MNKLKITSIALAALFIWGCQKEENPLQQSPSHPIQIQHVLGIGRITPREGLLDLSAPSNGKLVKIQVKAGEWVAQGQVLALLDQEINQAQVLENQAKIHSQEILILNKQRSLQIAQINQAKAAQDYQRDQKLMAQKAITESDLANSLNNWQNKSGELDKSQLELQSAQAQKLELQAALLESRAQLTQKAIRAPFAGKVLAWDAKIGDEIVSTKSMGSFAPGKSLIAETEIDELYADQIHVGQSAKIYSQVNHQLIGQGQIIESEGFLKKKSLFADENSQEDRRVLKIKVLLDSNSHPLINSKVDCQVQTGVKK